MGRHPIKKIAFYRKVSPKRLQNFLRHLHDNSGQWTEKYDGDEHMAPGEGCVDFSVLKLLSGYRGVYNFEVFSLEDLLFGKNTLKNAFKL